jgi:cell division septum initiation protein DivIVA
MEKRELQDLQRSAAQSERELESLRSELQGIRETVTQSERVERELQIRLANIAERQTEEIERLTLERDFYYKRVFALEDQNRQLADTVANYSLQAQKVERELTETANKYLRWGQKLERELARIDPDGAPARRFDAQDHA